MSEKLSACALALACSFLGCSNEAAPMELAKAELPAMPGTGFSATTRAELAKAGGPPLSAKAAEAARNAEAAPAAAAKPTDPAAKPADPATKPADPAAKPADPAAKPAAPAPAPATAPAPAGTGVSADLAAIKLSLPNEGWQRDSVAPGTFSFFTIGAGGKNLRYVFAYAYEDMTAPLEREAYTAWLGAKKIMKVTVDRQRGASWYLEGTDRSGDASFRYVITYGGRLITCGGSLHRQGPGAAQRDHRDELIKQAKAICESLTL